MSDSQSSAEKALSFISQKREDAEWRIAAENFLGRQVASYRRLNEAQKYSKWIDEGGMEFKGEFGEVSRYVIGIPTKAAKIIKDQGFQLGKKTMSSGSIFGINWLGETEGKGVYASTNPVLAQREYGPSLAIVDVAMGNQLTFNNNDLASLFVKHREPLAWGLMGLEAAAAFAIGKFGFNLDILILALATASTSFVLTRGYLFNQIYQNLKADTAIVPPNAVSSGYGALVDSIQDKNPFLMTNLPKRHDHWLVVRDPKRIKLVDIVNSPDEARKYAGAQSFASSAPAYLARHNKP